MQDEVTKHTRKIYQEVKNQEHTFWEKAREIVIEILIIVFAVTLSIWLHNWSDHRAEQKLTDEFLSGLKIDLKKDISLLDDNRKTFMEEDSYFKFLVDIYKSGAVDTIDERRIVGHFYFQQRSTHANVARYEGFKSNGKIGLIEDDSLKQAILAYYQQTIPSVNDGEELVNRIQDKLMDAQFTKDEKMSMRGFAKSFKALAYLEVARDNLGPAIGLYADAQVQAGKIIKMIDSYLDGRK